MKYIKIYEAVKFKDTLDFYRYWIESMLEPDDERKIIVDVTKKSERDKLETAQEKFERLAFYASFVGALEPEFDYDPSFLKKIKKYKYAYLIKFKDSIGKEKKHLFVSNQKLKDMKLSSASIELFYHNSMTYMSNFSSKRYLTTGSNFGDLIIDVIEEFILNKNNYNLKLIIQEGLDKLIRKHPQIAKYLKDIGDKDQIKRWKHLGSDFGIMD